MKKLAKTGATVLPVGVPGILATGLAAAAVRRRKH